MPSYVVTGAARGIGREFVRQLSANDSNTVFALVRSKKTSGQLEKLVDGRANVHIWEADITDHKALKAAAAYTATITGGTLDVLINNAAYFDSSVRIGYTIDGYPEGQEEVLEADFKKSFDVNVIGKVITISTGAADPEFSLKGGWAEHAPYSVSKAAVHMVVTKYAAEYASQGFIFLSLSPGFVATSEEQPTDDQMKVYKGMVEKFSRVKPDMTGLPLSPEKSVEMQLAVIAGLTPDQNGAFISHKGNEEWL